MLVTLYPYSMEPQDFACAKCDARYTAYFSEYYIKTRTETINDETRYIQRRFSKCPFCEHENYVDMLQPNTNQEPDEPVILADEPQE